MSIAHAHTHLHLTLRYITRTVLVPFMENTSTFNVVERMEADRELKKAIENGHKAAFLALELDFTTKEVDIQLIKEHTKKHSKDPTRQHSPASLLILWMAHSVHRNG